MGRSTKGKVNITSVNTNNIKDITDSDKPFIKQRGRKASEFFKDLTESGNEIYNDFIDEAYCPADEGENKKDKLTRAPYKWSQWRNYGGSEVIGVDETIPEIFWANIIDSAGGNAAERAPQTQEEFDTMKELKLIPEVVLYPSESAVLSAVDSSIIDIKHLASSNQSTMFTSERILPSKVASKVGIDYSTNTTTSIPEFEIKVTPYLTDDISSVKYHKRTLLNGVESTEDHDGVRIVGGSLFFAIFTARTLGELWPAITAWFNYMIGPFGPWGVALEAVKALWAKFTVWVLSLVEMPTIAAIWAVLGPVLSAIAIVISLVLVADVIWDKFNPEAEVIDAIYQYASTVTGTYIFEDIALSKYSYGFGRKYYQPEGFVEKFINQGGESQFYTLDDYNSGASWSGDNLFTRFPNKASGAPEKYLNWDFIPKSYQYDLDTPPPVIQYLVELVPVRNCKLSDNKPTAFIVMVVPDKYLAPKFEVITSVIGDKGKELYGNTSITFKNARYCDFIFLKDETKHGPDDWSNLWGLLGDLFTDYNNIGINTDINVAKGIFNSFTYYNGRDISMNGFDLMAAKIYGTDMSNWFTPNNDKFTVNYMNEASPNIIYNQYFRTEHNSDISSGLTELRRFWHTNEFVNIYGGAATCSGGLGVIYQEVPTIRSGYYTLTLECSGDVYFQASTNDSSCFEYGLYTWNGDSDRFKTSQSDMNEGWHYHDGSPFGASYYVYIPEYSRATLIDGSETIQFSSGFHKVIVKVKSTGTKNILFGMSDGSSISTCKLQKLPSSKAEDGSKRGCYNLITQENQTPQWFNWKQGNFPSKTISFIYDWAYNHTYSISITPSIPGENNGTISEIRVKWWKIDLTTETIEYEFTEGQQLDIQYVGNSVPVFKADVIFTLDSSFKVESPISIINNDEYLLDVIDQYAMLMEATIDFSGTKIGSTYQLNKNWNFKKHKYRLKELNISNTQSSDSVENITSISDSINISNTNVGGFFSQLSSIPRVICENTNISKYGTGQSYYAEGTEPYIVWKNSKTQIEESSLNLLLNTLAYSNTWNGYLDIAGDNPEITNELALANINTLVGRNWNVIYNAVTIPVITLVGDNPQTIEVGNSYVELGAIALDGKDGDISEDIVIDATDINVNTIGNYSVTYNVTDSDGNAAEEVIRTVNVLSDEVAIGTQTWKVRNLDVDDGLGGILSVSDEHTQQYGRYYSLDAALRIAANMDGWHVPSQQEWITLLMYLGGVNSSTFIKLKEEGTFSWINGNGTNESGFTLRAPGLYNPPSTYISQLKERAIMRSSTPAGGLYYYICDFYGASMSVFPSNAWNGGYLSVRLIRDYSHIPTISLIDEPSIIINVGDTYVDAGATADDTRYGNITSKIVTVNNVNTSVAGSYTVTYNVTTEDGYSAVEVVRTVNVIQSTPQFEEVTIGTQTWMAVNLDIDDGGGGIYAYDDNEANVATYGRLYTWDAAMRVAASIDGWHLPSDAEWTTLSDYLGGNAVAGGKLKETGTTHWASPNTGATNENGFTALPGGYRNYGNGNFYYIGKYGYWWSSTEYSEDAAYGRSLGYNSRDLLRNSNYYKANGFSVRLIKD